MFNAVKVLGGLIKIVGNSTGTPIGNVLDALKVIWKDSSGNDVGTSSNPIYTTPISGPTRAPINIYNTAFAVASGVPTTIVTYTVPVLKAGALERVAITGENIGYFEVLVNNIAIDSRHTMFGMSLNTEFNFTSSVNLGYPLISGDIVTIKVLHARPYIANFSARIQAIEF